MRLNDLLVTTYEYKGEEIPIDLSFDNVLDVLDVMSVKGLYEFQLAEMCLALLFGEDVIDIEDCFIVWNDVYDKFLTPEKDEYIEYDLKGNPMPKKKEKKLIDLEEDAEYIYASFVQAYNINLFEQQTKMHWFEFKSLLNGLPENTIMKQIMQIRRWEPSKGESEEYKKAMREMQEIYSLENDVED